MPDCLLNKNKNGEETIPGDPLQAPWDAGLCSSTGCFLVELLLRLLNVEAGAQPAFREGTGPAKGASAAEQEETGAVGPCPKASHGNTPQATSSCKSLTVSAVPWQSQLQIAFLPQILLLSPQVSCKSSFDSVIFILVKLSARKGEAQPFFSATLHYLKPPSTEFPPQPLQPCSADWGTSPGSLGREASAPKLTGKP